MPLNKHAKHGTIFVVGAGPGNSKEMTLRARDILQACDAVIGYKTYVDLIVPLIEGKEIISSGMTQEKQRCERAIAEAAGGKIVALVSGGDAGIYGMAGILLELAQKSEQAKKIPIEIVPGVPAFVAAAAALGAPLMNDFAVISLSDLLSPWKKIACRLEAAASGDFVTCLYNPKSRQRTSQITKAREIFLTYRDGQTPCAIVKNVSRSGQNVIKTSLDEMLNHTIDMLCLVIIGNSETTVQESWMITSRGYQL
jgi:precorrin-3B C17-methyltransferase